MSKIKTRRTADDFVADIKAKNGGKKLPVPANTKAMQERSAARKELKGDYPEMPKALVRDKNNESEITRNGKAKMKRVVPPQASKMEQEMAKLQAENAKLKAAAKTEVPVTKVPAGVTTLKKNGQPKKKPPVLSAREQVENGRSNVVKKPKGKKQTATVTVKVAKPKGEAKRSRARSTEPRGMAVEVGKLASRKQGASRDELIELTGWKQQAWKWYFVNSKDSGFCQKFGYKLDVLTGEDGETRYKITKQS